jgi:hypothetical protein
LFLSRSAWLIESHWSSCRLPGKTNNSASRSGNHGALSGSPLIAAWLVEVMATRKPKGAKAMRTDIYERITNQIVSELEKGVRPWLKPWNAEHAAGRITRPLRGNGIPY